MKAKKERKTFLKAPVTRNITHLFYFARVATAGINNIPMKETTFWALSDLNVSVRVSIGPCSALHVTWIFVSISFWGFFFLFLTHTVMPHDNGAFWTCSTWFIFPQCSSEMNSNMHQQWNGILFVIKAGRKLDNFLPGQLSHSSLIWKWELFEVCCLAGPKLYLSSANHRKNGTLTFPIAAHVWTGARVIKEGCAIPADQCHVSRITL